MVGVLSEYLSENWYNKLKEEYVDPNAEQLIYMEPTSNRKRAHDEKETPAKEEKVRILLGCTDWNRKRRRQQFHKASNRSPKSPPRACPNSHPSLHPKPNKYGSTSGAPHVRNTPIGQLARRLRQIAVGPRRFKRNARYATVNVPNEWKYSHFAGQISASLGNLKRTLDEVDSLAKREITTVKRERALQYVY